MQNLIIIGKRWFRKSAGNTYHSVSIYIDGNFSHRIPYAHGYDQQYVDTAFAWLEAQGYFPPQSVNNVPLWQICKDEGINLSYSATDVSRKKDL